MAQINKPTDYFNTKLYTGTGAEQSITGVGFQPDLTWIKNRGDVDWHRLLDSIRGATKELYSNATNAETTETQSLKSFDSDGFTLGTLDEVNQSANNFVAWNWLASNTTASNTDGSITSTVSANTTSGFSIVTYTTPSSGTVTVGHGLGVKPDVLITKSRDNTYNWDVLHKSINDNGVGRMIFTSAAYLTGSNPYASTTPTSSVFSFSGDFYGASNNVTYCFAEKKGFSKFGKYTGNGSTDGSFVYTGFKPAWVMWKRTDTAGYDWDMYDTARDTYNLAFKELIANSNAVESSSTVLALDILSNGFKLRTSNANGNASGGTYIYMAFAENPLVGTNDIPTTAR